MAEASPERLWIVARSSGEHFLVIKEPIEGIDAWARGQQGVTVLEYRLTGVVYPRDKQ